MKISKSKHEKLNGRPYHFAIILSRFNDKLGYELYQNTQAKLVQHGVREKRIELIRVPGSLEIPLVASLLAKKQRHDVIIALGVIIKGKTPHWKLVSEQCYRGLMDTSLFYGVPITFGVLTVENVKQAVERISKNKLNKGAEYAETAIEMAMLVS